MKETKGVSKKYIWRTFPAKLPLEKEEYKRIKLKQDAQKMSQLDSLLIH